MICDKRTASRNLCAKKDWIIEWYVGALEVKKCCGIGNPKNRSVSPPRTRTPVVIVLGLDAASLVRKNIKLRLIAEPRLLF